MDFGKLIVDSFVGSLLMVVCDKLISLGLSFVQREGIDAQLENWKKMLQEIYWHLDDAEDKQLFGDGVVKSWLEDAKELAYDMEDLLDDFAIEVAKQDEGVESSTTGVLKKRKRPSFPFLVFDRNMRAKVQDIESRLQDILARKDRLRLKESAGSRSTSIQDNKRLPSTSLKEACFLGREKEENEIVQLLTTDVNHTIPTVIALVGMGGVGKTALAQRVYNDPQVASQFEVKAWTCVSDEFDISSITSAILHSITPINCEGKDINWLQVNLKENLSGKKFLIVFDDVWNEKYEEWTVLLKPLESGAEGSKVIITTRNCEVASIARALAYPLKELQHDDCIALLAYHALSVNNFDNHPHLEVIGKKIVDKCRRLPLAVKTLGGLLRTAIEPSEWEAILNSKLWDLPKERNEILPALKLSYVHLPSSLKRCFAYCASKPKDYRINRDKLIHWWMAEGLLGDNNRKNRWDIGLDYFGQLVSRSFFQQGKESLYLMHDLIHDLAMSISGVTCFSEQQLKLEAYESNTSFTRARYACFVPTHYVTLEKLRRYHKMKKLRSFLALRSNLEPCYLPQKALYDLVSELKAVRVFSMSHYHITEVPNSICELKYLRHLDFSYTNIQMLPKSIGSIYHLEALLLRGCKRLAELPQEIGKLCNLQYLDIRDTPKLRAMPNNLKNLKMLPRFIVGTQKGSRLEELKHMMHPEKELFISELQQVKEVQDARNVNLCEKRGIDKLVLEWAQDSNDSRNEEDENAILHFLQPHINLRILGISHYGGTRFPSWLGSALYTSIVHVDVHGCHNVTLLPAFGQLPSLKELHVYGLNSVRKVGNEFYGSEKPFPMLRTLVFDKMLAWEDWSHSDGVHEVGAPFSCLQHLIIRHCPRLVGRLPGGLDSLTKLEIVLCPRLEESSHVISLPSLHKLHFEDCNVGMLNCLVDLTVLTTLEIYNIPELTYFESGFINSLVKLEEVKIENCQKLNYLWQDSNDFQNLASLMSFTIENCPRLASLMNMPPYLQCLTIIKCDSLPTSEFESSRFPTSLKLLRIEGCQGLESVPQIFGMEYLWVDGMKNKTCINLRSLELDGFSHLKTLSIKNCGALEMECFPCLPITMSDFRLWGCPHAKLLPNNLHQLTSLETLYIVECENIMCLPEGGLPPNLQYFHIFDCKNIKTPMKEWGIHGLTSLFDLVIDGNIRGVGEKPCFFDPSGDDEDDAWGFLPSSLRGLRIKNMKEGERLSSGLCNHLPSLQLLSIENCPRLRYLPKDGLPSSLGILNIEKCGRLEEGFSKPNGDYYHLLHELSRVRINCEDRS